MPAFELPFGEVVTTARGCEPGEGSLFLVREAGLEPIAYDAAWDRMDPTGAGDRAHATSIDRAALPRELSRFVKVHGLQNGGRLVGNFHY